MPLNATDEPKSSFVPSKWEMMKVRKVDIDKSFLFCCSQKTAVAICLTPFVYLSLVMMKGEPPDKMHQGWYYQVTRR